MIKDKINEFIYKNHIQVIFIEKNYYKKSNQNFNTNVYSITLVNNYNVLHFVIKFTFNNIHDILKNTFNLYYIDDIKIIDTINHRISFKAYKNLCDSTYYLDLDNNI